MYHPSDVAYWLENGDSRGPLYTEFELTGRCNCNCIFCGVDYLVNSSAGTIDTGTAKRVLDQLHALGNRSVMIAGHGEPLLHDDALEIVRYSSERMSTSITTNGLSLIEERLPLMDDLKWMRFSINGCDAENYSAIHKVTPDMFDLLLSNVESAVRRKVDLNLDVTIGTQLVLLEENASGVLGLARRLKDLGVDYFSVKPYSQHPLSNHHLTVDYDMYLQLDEQLNELAADSFKVIYRARSMAKVSREKPYRKCYGTNFLSFISASGDVWECNVFAGDERFLVGNVQQEGLEDIWRGEKRQAVRRFIEEDMDIDECRDICRMDECNCCLWRLKNPLGHDDFI